MPKYAELIYNGFWFSPERELLQVLIDKSQEMVAGRVRLKLYKGGVHVIGRDSPHSLYDQDLVTFEEGAVAYDHNDAAGFIKLNALRLRTLAKRRKKAAKRRKATLPPRESDAAVAARSIVTTEPPFAFAAASANLRLRERVLERLGGRGIGNLGKASGDRLGRALALVEIDAGRLADMRHREDAGARAEDDARGRVLAHEKEHARRHRFRPKKLRRAGRKQAFGHRRSRGRREHVDADVVLRAFEMQHVHQPDHRRLSRRRNSPGRNCRRCRTPRRSSTMRP